MTMDGSIVFTPGMTLEQMEKQVILKTYSHFMSNKTSTARSLGISIRTLDAKLEVYKKEEKAEKGRTDALGTQQQRDLKRHRAFTTNSDGTLDVFGHDKADADALARERSNGTRSPSRGIEKDYSQAKATQRKDGEKAQARLRLESAEKAGQKSAMPVQEREEVQEVSSPDLAGNRE